jgi:hypothetical protein
MIDEFRGRAALGAERLAGRVLSIGFEPRESAIFDHRNRPASGDAEPAIAVNTLRAGRIGHRILLPVVKRVPDPATMVRWSGPAFASLHETPLQEALPE